MDGSHHLHLGLYGKVREGERGRGGGGVEDKRVKGGSHFLI